MFKYQRKNIFPLELWELLEFPTVEHASRYARQGRLFLTHFNPKTETKLVFGSTLEHPERPSFELRFRRSNARLEHIVRHTSYVE